MIRWLAYYDLPSVLHPQFLPAQKFMWEKAKNKRNCRVLYLPCGNKGPALQMYFWFICFTNQNPLLYFWIKSNMKYVADLLQENFLHNFHFWNFLAHAYLWKKSKPKTDLNSIIILNFHGWDILVEVLLHSADILGTLLKRKDGRNKNPSYFQNLTFLMRI